MTRYHPLLAALHWIMALLIVILLMAGTFLLEPLANDDPLKIDGLAGHMLFGLTVAALLVVRLVTRLVTDKPPHAATGSAVLDTVGKLTHWLFYILIALMVASGLGMALSVGLFPIVYGGAGGPIPDALQEIAPRLVHGTVAPLLAILIVLHIAAAVYHQVVLKDGLMRRMGFGKRRAD